MNVAAPLQLTLMRHAHAEPKHPSGTDEARALDRRGLTEAAEMARRLLERSLRPDILLVSSSVRTRQTATPLVRAFALTEDRVVYEPALYLAEARALLAHLQRMPTTARHVLLIAHNPGISELARNLAASGTAPDFEPAGLLFGTLDCESWGELDFGQLRSLQYDAPRISFELDD